MSCFTILLSKRLLLCTALLVNSRKSRSHMGWATGGVEKISFHQLRGEVRMGLSWMPLTFLFLSVATEEPIKHLEHLWWRRRGGWGRGGMGEQIRWREKGKQGKKRRVLQIFHPFQQLEVVLPKFFPTSEARARRKMFHQRYHN